MKWHGMRRLAQLAAMIVMVMAATAVPATADGATDPKSGNDVCDNSRLDRADGTQNPDGMCSDTVQGEIPPKNRMPSTVIRFPRDDDIVVENEPFTIRTTTINLKTGFFDDPVKEYVVFPQTLDENFVIQGHSHVTVQKIEDPNEPPGPEVFAFFAGLHDLADGNGELTAEVENGLPAGDYRVCTLVSSFAHQPVLVAVEQRGAQDDCARFTVAPADPCQTAIAADYSGTWRDTVALNVLTLTLNAAGAVTAAEAAGVTTLTGTGGFTVEHGRLANFQVADLVGAIHNYTVHSVTCQHTGDETTPAQIELTSQRSGTTYRLSR